MDYVIKVNGLLNKVRKHKKIIVIAVAILAIIIALLTIPISSKTYDRNDTSHNSTYGGYTKIKITRYLLTAKIEIPNVMHGACDHVKLSTSYKLSETTITVTTPSESHICTANLVYSDVQHYLLWPLWGKHLVVKSYDKTLFDIR